MKLLDKKNRSIYSVLAFVVDDNGERRIFNLDDVIIIPSSVISYNRFTGFYSGDILACTEIDEDGGTWVFEYERIEDRMDVYAKRCICYDPKIKEIDWCNKKPNYLIDINDIKELRYATQEEIEMLDNATKQNEGT